MKLAIYVVPHTVLKGSLVRDGAFRRHTERFLSQHGPKKHPTEEGLSILVVEVKVRTDFTDAIGSLLAMKPSFILLHPELSKLPETSIFDLLREQQEKSPDVRGIKVLILDQLTEEDSENIPPHGHATALVAKLFPPLRAPIEVPKRRRH